MKNKNSIYRAKCRKTNQQFLIETNNSDTVVNFLDISDKVAETIGSTRKWENLHVASSLRKCIWCGSKNVGKCNCAKNHNFCVPKGTYHYQCLFCNELEPVFTGNRAGDVKSLRLCVTSANYDNIGALLSEMGLEFASYRPGMLDCDVLFINCGTKDPIDAQMLASFVRNGGCLYASDFAVDYVTSAFPGIIDAVREGKTGEYSAEILDGELKSILGTKIRVKYDLPVWAVIKKHSGMTMISGVIDNRTLPMMVKFDVGKGSIFYTSFHNYAQASEKEKIVLKMMLLRQISTVCGSTVEEVGDILGLNITDLGNKVRN